MSAELSLVEPEAGTSGKSYVSIHGTPVPTEWLVQRHDSKRFPTRTLVSERQHKKAVADQKWGRGKEQWLAATAAGVHLMMFAYNLSFWGSEGMAPDRYWPANTRLKMGIKPGRYGNLDGAKRIWYENLSMLEGLK